MATKVDYKFKPYTPTNLKLADTSATKETAQRKALETQKINLEARLRAQGIDPEQAGGEFDNRNIIEKALNLQQDQGLLLDFFEIINRPVEAVKAGIMAGLDGKNFVQGAWEGLSGQTVTSGSDFAEEALGIDIPDSGAGKFAASMAVDILLDPLTYLPAGFFAKRIGKLFRRTIQRANTALTGEMLQVLSKYGVLDDAGKAFTNLTDLEVALAKMEKTKADEIIVELKKAASAGDNADIFFKGQAGGFDKEKYIDGTIDRNNYRNITGFEERTNWLRETQGKIEQLQIQYKNNPTKLKEEINKLLPDSFKGKISDDALAELSLYDEVKGMADDLGMDYKTVMTTTSVKGKTDVGVYRKFRLGDEEFYVRVLSFDGKKAAGAYGTTAIATMTGKRFMFGGGVDDIYIENADELNKVFEEAGLSDEVDALYNNQPIPKKIPSQPVTPEGVPFDINNKEQVIDFIRKNPDDIKIVPTGQNPSDIKISGSTMDENQFLQTIKRRFPEVNSLNDIRANETILNQLQPWERQQILSGGGVFVGGPRAYVLVEYRGQKIPFYLSSGSAGKKAAAGVWYPYMGQSRTWINKGTDAQIQAFYNNPVFEAISEQLGKKFPAQDIQQEIVRRVSTSGKLGEVTTFDEVARQQINSIFPKNPGSVGELPVENFEYFTKKLPKNIKQTFIPPKAKAVPKKVVSKVKVKKSVKSINPYTRIDELQASGKLTKKQAIDLKKRLDNVQKAMMRKKLGDNGYIYLAEPGQKGVFAKFSEVEDYLDYSKTSVGWMPGGKAKAELKTLRTAKGDLNKNTIKALEGSGYKIKDDAGKMLDDVELQKLMDKYNAEIAGTKGQQFRYSGKLAADQATIEQIIKDGKSVGLDKIFEEGMTTGVRNVQVSLLDFWEETKGGTALGKFAKSINPYIKKFQSLFDPYARLPKEVQDAIRNMRGKLAVEFQTKTLRLAGLEEAFIKAFPDLSPQIITQIIEAGAYIDASGVIKYAARTMDAKDYIRHMLNSLDSGKPFQLRRFADDATQLNFVNQLNDIMDGAVGVDDLFSIVEKNGVKALNFTGTAEDLQKMLAYADLNLKPTMLDFGKINLSDDGIKVLREWKDIGEAINLKTDVQKLLVQEGGFTNFLFNGSIDDTYMRHLLTKDAYEYMAKNMPGVLSKFAKPGGEVFQASKFIGTIDETNDFLRAYYDAPMDVFDPNFFRSTEDFLTRAFRNIEQGKMMDLLLNSKDKYGEYLMRVVDNTRPVREALSPDDIMIKSFKEEFSTMYKNFSPEVQASFDRFLEFQGYTKDKALVINRSMHGLIKEVEKAFVQLPDWVKMYDKFLNTWKGLTLITPGFHMRNLFGNSFNSYAVGMDLASQVKYSRVAMLELNKFDEFQKILAQGGELTKAQQKIYDRVSKFRSSGLIQSHRGVRDLEQVKQAVEEALKKGKPGAREAYDKLVRLNFNLAEKMDDTQRYMLYRWKLDKTGDFQTAVDTVAESLFDYSRLTSFEKDVMKRIVPFYTFMKNNFVFQAKNIFRNPQQYAKAGRAYKYYLEDIAGFGTDDLPDYVTENMWLPIPVMITKNDKEGIAFLKANLPISDFTELVENPFKKGVISITAPMKLAIELGVGRDLFTGEPLEAFPGETSRMEPGTGILSGIRDERGTLALAKTPLMQKVMADIGLRTPLNVGSAALDFADSLLGYQGAPDGIGDFLQRAGVAGVQEVEKIELTRLYQDLERLRELKKYYEQETGNQLPVLPRR